MSAGSVNFTDKMIEEVFTADNELTLFVRAHLYLEHYIDLAIEKKFHNFNDLLDDTHFTFNYKIKILYGLGFLDKWLYHYAKTMNEIRNQLAHNLNPNDDKINSKIESMKIPWLDEISIKMDKYSRYRTAAIFAVKEIKNALEQNRNTVLGYNFDLER